MSDAKGPSALTAIGLVASNTLRQTIRQRLYFNIGVFGVGMVLLAMVVGQITFGYPDRVVRSIGLSGVSMAVDLMALLVGVSLVYDEIDKKTLFVVLTRPLSRASYMIGRFVGLVLAIVLALLGFSLIFVAVLEAVGGDLRAADVFALVGVIPEAAILGAFGLLLSAFSTPTLSAGVGIGFWIVAATTDDLVNLTVKSEQPLRALVRGLYYVLPSFARFDFRSVAVYAGEVVAADFWLAMAYGGLYAAGLLGLASVVMSRREML